MILTETNPLIFQWLWRAVFGTACCCLMLASPARADVLNFRYEVGHWKYEDRLAWLYPVEGDEGATYYYSPHAGWMWHNPALGEWFFSWGFASPQWSRLSSLARAAHRAAIPHPEWAPVPASDPVTIVSAEVDGDRLHATVEYLASGPGSFLFLFVEDSLADGSAHAWISRNGRGDSGGELIRESVTFDLAPLDVDWGRSPGQSFTLRIPVFEALDIRTHRLTHDTAGINWETAVPAQVSVEYGLSEGDLAMSTDLIALGNTEHRVVLRDLEPETTYFYRTVSVTQHGTTNTSSVSSFETAPLQKASQVSQFGITWTFSREHTVGQFVNGDWWVLGPVSIVNIDPRPGPHPSGESIADRIQANVWGDTSLRDNSNWGNGSMVVMRPAGGQSYDSRNSNYSSNPSNGVRVILQEGPRSDPFVLEANRSMISSISHTPDDGYPSQLMFHAIMWSSGKSGARVMRTAAVLTSLPEIPPGDAFRPTYIGSEKRIVRLGDVRWDRLLNLKADWRREEVPPWSQYERYFERPWLDHLNGSWQGQLLLPSQNQPSYGREFARIIGTASMLLHIDVPLDQKEKLLIGLMQYGIDLRGIVEAGGTWNAGGGHTSGRKWPILFAGLMLEDDHFLNMPESAVFHEDTQTYWGRGWHGQRALWQMITHHGTRQPYLHISPTDWPEWDKTASLGGRSGAQVSESYRTCCNPIAWPGQTLAALLMNAKAIWNHDAYFEGVDDWMREGDIYAANRQGRSRPSMERGLFDHDIFVEHMWRLYRTEAPEQPHGTSHRMWDVNQSGALRWVPNTMPTDLGPPVYGPNHPY